MKNLTLLLLVAVLSGGCSESHTVPPDAGPAIVRDAAPATCPDFYVYYDVDGQCYPLIQLPIDIPCQHDGHCWRGRICGNEGICVPYP